LARGLRHHFLRNESKQSRPSFHRKNKINPEEDNLMKNQVISYRRAQANLDEVRVEQLQQQQATRLVSYRGATGSVKSGHVKIRQTITYRGVTAEMDV